MKRFTYFLLISILSSLLISCTAISNVIGRTEKSIEPGDMLGDMTVKQGSPDLPYPLFWQFCQPMPNRYQPAKTTTDCDVPKMSGVSIPFGWLATETHLDANMAAMTYELSIDSHLINLKTFDWHEATYLQHGENNKGRSWIIDLVSLSPGKHTLQLAWTSKIAVDDGSHVYQPGTYEHQVHFTILEKVKYPTFSSTVEIGQHPYSSEKAQLDFLLHLPGDYGKNPQQKWPLLVYLHGTQLRGATLELLMAEPFPHYVDQQKDFPFIAISPLGDGGYEFWSKDNLMNQVFQLLDEIQSTLSVDTKRIYLTGNDMGGNGVWSIALRYPQYFAALAPMSGYYGYPFEVPKNICDLKDVPIWVFHGSRDPFVPVQEAQKIVDALTACGGKAQIEINPRMTNDVSSNVYTDPELYKWFLSHSLE